MPQPSTQDTPERSYAWDEVAMQVNIHWFTPEQPGQPRQVMLAVTTYHDAPIARLVEEESLEDLLPHLEAMLAELEQSLPIRKMQWQQRANQRKRKSTTSRPPSQAQTPTPTPTHSTTQIALF